LFEQFSLFTVNLCKCRRNNPHTPVKWAKWGNGIHLAGPREVAANNVTTRYQLITTGIEIGGTNGRKTGYFEVELTHDNTRYGEMAFNVGMYRPGLVHSSCNSYSKGDAWHLSAHSGGRRDYSGGGYVDRQGMLEEGDRVGVLVDLEEKEGRQGGSVRFFVNGVEFGSGFESGVAGPLVGGVRMFRRGQKVTLLPDARSPVVL
jgi:hypothetical protein